jgi:protein SCO1/2
MNKSSKPIEWIVWGGLILIIAAVGGAFVWSRLDAGPMELPVLGQLSDFHLTNQNNESVCLADFRGKVWVADVIFTRCPGPCARMTRNLAELQSALPKTDAVHSVTLTSDPEYDSPSILKKYSDHYGADNRQWSFLTGDKKVIRELAVNDFKFVVVEKPAKDREVPDDLFIHSTFFMLVDGKGQIHGWMDRQKHLHAYFDSDDPVARAELVTAVRQLVKSNET